MAGKPPRHCYCESAVPLISSLPLRDATKPDTAGQIATTANVAKPARAKSGDPGTRTVHHIATPGPPLRLRAIVRTVISATTDTTSRANDHDHNRHGNARRSMPQAHTSSRGQQKPTDAAAPTMLHTIDARLLATGCLPATRRQARGHPDLD